MNNFQQTTANDFARRSSPANNKKDKIWQKKRQARNGRGPGEPTGQGGTGEKEKKEAEVGGRAYIMAIRGACGHVYYVSLATGRFKFGYLREETRQDTSNMGAPKLFPALSWTELIKKNLQVRALKSYPS